MPVCLNCESWTRVVDDLGRQASTHPTDPDFVVYSTIRKSPPPATDSQRQSDEDLWLLWRGSPNSANWIRWQLTGDEISTSGDNFLARWSPDGTQIAFVHTASSGRYEIWRLDVSLPSEPPSASFDPRGSAERVVPNGRDPAWLDDSHLLFVRDEKLFQIDVVNSTRDGENEVQLTFDPPIYVNADPFVDRHPAVSPDGIAIFSTSGREDVGDLVVGAFAISQGAFPETTATSALIGLQSPGTPILNYPLADGADTLLTPSDNANPYLRLRSLPVADGGTYVIGARRDEEFFPPTEETYCDTLLTQEFTLTSGEADTVRFYFEIVRGGLIVTSGRNNTEVFWERLDGRAGGSLGGIAIACQTVRGGCLLSNQVDVFDNVIPNSLEPYLVTGVTNVGDSSQVQVTITPGESTYVKVFCDADTCACAPAPVNRRASAASATIADSRGAARSAGGSLRAASGNSAIWRIDVSDPNRPSFTPIITARDVPAGETGISLQTPTLSPVFAGGSRFLAYASNESGDWGLYLQKLDGALNPVGDPVAVDTPGSSDNYVCTRNIFHPSWVTGSVPGSLKLLVTMTECPDNAFSSFGLEDDPWSLGELNVWDVVVPIQ